jgi:hypothetical protein
MRDFTSAAMLQLADAEQARDEAEEHQRAKTRRRSCCATAHDGTMSVATAATRATLIASAVGWRRRSLVGAPGVPANATAGAHDEVVKQQEHTDEGPEGSLGAARPGGADMGADAVGGDHDPKAVEHAAVQLQRTARGALTRRKTAVKEEDEVDDEADNEGEEERPRVSAVI